MLQERIHEILKTIPKEVTLLAAVKKQPVASVREAYSAGIRHFGHNYVQEAAQMIPAIEAEVTWHMIGHLQRNKAKLAVSLFDCIDSLDSLRLADELEKRAANAACILPVMIEVNIGEEDAKTGVAPDAAMELLEYASKLPHLSIYGMMTMGPLVVDPANSRQYFHKTRRIYEEMLKMNLPGVELKYLSMGMSHDYPIAIEEGANLVRLGTALFGPRT